MTKTNKYSVPALEKALDILEFLAKEAAPRSQTEIAVGLNRGPNDIFRVLVVLEERGYLLRDEVSGKYHLSLRLYTLAHTHSPVEELRRAAFLPMGELAEATGQSCHLGVPYKNKLLIVSQAKSPGQVSLSISEGTLFPLLSTASGRVLLANLSQEKRAWVLEQDVEYAAMKPVQQKKVQAELNAIHTKGYNLATSDITQGVTDCATLVGDPESELIAVLAVSSLTSNLSQDVDEGQLVAAVISAAKTIAERVGV